MSPSESLSVEVETLRRLRRHRADRVERALSAAQRAQRTLLEQIAQAQQALEHTRLEEARQCAQLLSQHQGQVMTFKALKDWSAQERNLSAGTQREEDQLHALHEQKAQQAEHISSVQKQVSQCLREVEKLQELASLLIQEEA
ncbi:type III secretion system stalk subunit SctO [Pseudomonas sp. R11F]|uniref:Type III secretion protein n=1 Tax=Pseudomonas palleroniana TaxID=191390 RepID=A0A2L1JEW7_9PSED|nr:MULTISPECIES: YscO family type III secretion system apparatus protein [Pseudomonas]AVE07024.1 type III secretion protein [Pseudomonas palleroniana]MBI6908872.1 YscO family type III secretion system apparatus protein [Pseudomonas palleroniana]NCE84187.1 type III secretion protein [Pseudomonas sp. Q1]UOP08393.1 YscO family type III secretion system apparatus protein [Pseudomonas palleroniana]